MVSEPRFSCEKISFKLYVMRLNHVESFYTFLLCFRNESREERGQPIMARPFARATDHGHTPCRGGRQWPRLRGQPPAVRPQGAAARDAPARTSR
ncbi:hypothetical protein GW17_00045007 [Ensete ventricosum]|nr:hypothetical protein GW17_00045007 [Ensete ventricosum]